MRTFFVAALSVALAGCVSPEFREEQARLAAEKEAARVAAMPVCETDEQCSAMWDMAQFWIVENAGYKIQTSTNVVVETYSPSDSSLALRVKAVKEPIGEGKHRIGATVWCDNFLGCVKNPNIALEEFYTAVRNAGS